MCTIAWEPGDVGPYDEGEEGGPIRRRPDLTALYGEREYLRRGVPVDVDGDGDGRTEA